MNWKQRHKQCAISLYISNCIALLTAHTASLWALRTIAARENTGEYAQNINELYLHLGFWLLSRRARARTRVCVYIYRLNSYCVHLFIESHMRTSCKLPSQQRIWFRMCESQPANQPARFSHELTRIAVLNISVFRHLFVCVCRFFYCIIFLQRTFWDYEYNLNIDCFPGHKINNNKRNAPSNGQQQTTNSNNNNVIITNAIVAWKSRYTNQIALLQIIFAIPKRTQPTMLASKAIPTITVQPSS